jgi:iron complex outermembrane recepter protein
MTTPTPVTAISSEDLQVLAPTTLAEALVQLPQFLNSDTPQSQGFGSSGASGGSFVNLRGIGASRTLTLLDGRRVTPATRSGAVDIALLPESLVQRIEVVTGGASAAYGSDAVSGVVNFILDTDFDGVKASAQAGISEIGDNENVEFGLTWGTAIGERGHLVTSAEVYRANGVKGYTERDWFNSWGVIANTPANIAAGQPARVTVPNARSTNYTAGGLVTGYRVGASPAVLTTSPLVGTQFLRGGVPTTFNRGAYWFPTGTGQSGGSGSDPNANETWIMPDQLRGNGFAHFKYDFTDRFAAFAQVLVGHSSNTFEKDAANMSTPWEATIFRENPFLPASLGAQMDVLGATSLRLGRVASSADLGGGRTTNRNNLRSSTVGFAGELNDRWSYNGYYQYGQNKAVLYYTNTSRIDRLFRAVDVVTDPASGRVVCRSSLSFPTDGCVPMNILGEGSPSPEAIQYVNGDASEQNQRIVQQASELTIQGKLFDNWAGTVSIATGAAWRKETLRNVPRRFPAELDAITAVPTAASQGYRGLPTSYSGQPNLFERTIYTRLSGEYNVTEAFFETLVPLARNLPLMQSLDFNGAYRFADYSGSGGIPAWKLGLDWQVADPLRVRATVSRDVRAGTLSERFDFSGTGATVDDPFLPSTVAPYTITSIRGGNPNIDPEKADTLTFGVVYQPAWLQGFSLSADYYDIKINDAIAQLTVQQIADECFAGATDLCGRITRNTTTGLITQINNTFLNVAESRTKGVDIEVGYQRPITLFGGDESLSIRAFGTFVDELSTTNLGAATIDRAGQTGLGGGAPDWQANLGVNYQRGPLTVFLQERYIGRGILNAIWGPADVDDNRVGGVFYTNLRLSYDLGDTAGQFTVFGNVTNLFDRAPPLAPTFGFNGSNHTNEALFDVLGRRYTVGVRMNL